MIRGPRGPSLVSSTSMDALSALPQGTSKHSGASSDRGCRRQIAREQRVHLDFFRLQPVRQHAHQIVVLWYGAGDCELQCRMCGFPTSGFNRARSHWERPVTSSA